MKQVETATDGAENVEQSQETLTPAPVISRAQLDGVHKTASQLIEEPVSYTHLTLPTILRV